MIIKFRRRPQNASHVHILSLSRAFDRFIEINHLIYDWPVGVLEMKKRHACCCSMPCGEECWGTHQIFSSTSATTINMIYRSISHEKFETSRFLRFSLSLLACGHRVTKSWPPISFTCVQQGPGLFRVCWAASHLASGRCTKRPPSNLPLWWVWALFANSTWLSAM
jgi:hypothetical protein